jgi:hypothetical protein
MGKSGKKPWVVEGKRETEIVSLFLSKEPDLCGGEEKGE